MLSEFFLKFILAAVFNVGMDEGYATVFGTPGDKHAGGALACEQRPIPQNEPICAHRYLACGTKLHIYRGKSVTTCRVADRGPYGVNQHGRWRGLVDLGPMPARSIGVDGRSWVRVLYQLPPKGHKMYRSTKYLSPRPKVRRSRDSS
jgi:rare lipoprotein A (peptidoglycan hydrolase)